MTTLEPIAAPMAQQQRWIVRNAETEFTPHFSIGIMAWNEEEAIDVTLASLFRQTFFARLHELGMRCEIVCVANGCTDNTARVAEQKMQELHQAYPFKDALSCRVVDVKEKGKTNAWNQFVHKLSARSAQFLFLMDGDILVRHVETLWNMYSALVEHPEAVIAVDEPLKDIRFKAKQNLKEVFSLATSRMTQSMPAQLTGQLYCVRAPAARNIYLPKDLGAVEDGFIKAIVCTDWLSQPSSPARIVRAKNANHIFQAYTSVGDIFRNQKRQMIGLTINHLVLDKYLKSLPPEARANLAATVRELEQRDPAWLRRMLDEHVKGVKHCWQLFPGLLRFRFQRLMRLQGVQRVRHAPVALAGFCMTLVSSWAAFRMLRQGQANYWPDTRSGGLRAMEPGGQ